MQYDFNIKCSKTAKDRERQLILKRAFELGYDCILWTTSVVGRATNAQIKPLKPVCLDVQQRREAMQYRSIAKKSTHVQVDAEGLGLLPMNKNEDVRQLNRITVVVDDLVDAQTLTIGNEVLRQFDLVAACPGDATVFAYLCKSAEIDIISFDFSHRLPFTLNKKLIDEAVKRGIHFEVCYSHLLGGAGPRREVMSGTRTLVQYLRGRHVVLSSGADNAAFLRGPADVANMASVLGLGCIRGEEDSLTTDATTRTCSRAIQHASGRRLRFLPVEIMSQEQLELRWPELRKSSRPGVLPSRGHEGAFPRENDAAVKPESGRECMAQAASRSSGRKRAREESDEEVGDDEDGYVAGTSRTSVEGRIINPSQDDDYGSVEEASEDEDGQFTNSKGQEMTKKKKKKKTKKKKKNQRVDNQHK